MEFVGWKTRGEFPLIPDMFIYLHHPLFDATILRQGAQLIHFQPKGGEPLLWSAELSTFEKGKAFRGGIPLCWPWFGKAGVPSHGFARIVEWEMTSQVESEKGIQLVFTLSDSPTTRTIWPHTFMARVEMNLGREVKISLHVKAMTESTGALHTYFTCRDIEELSLTGLGAQYNDALKEGQFCENKDKALHVHHAIDRIYTQPEAKTFLKENSKTVTITHQNHSDVVVWNPWSEGAAKLSDMKGDDYQKMICVETARISKPLRREDSLHVQIEIS